jgi:hypothetical protein
VSSRCLPTCAPTPGLRRRAGGAPDRPGLPSWPRATTAIALVVGDARAERSRPAAAHEQRRCKAEHGHKTGHEAAIGEALLPREQQRPALMHLHQQVHAARASARPDVNDLRLRPVPRRMPPDGQPQGAGEQAGLDLERLEKDHRERHDDGESRPAPVRLPVTAASGAWCADVSISSPSLCVLAPNPHPMCGTDGTRQSAERLEVPRRQHPGLAEPCPDPDGLSTSGSLTVCGDFR